MRDVAVGTMTPPKVQKEEMVTLSQFVEMRASPQKQAPIVQPVKKQFEEPTYIKETPKQETINKSSVHNKALTSKLIATAHSPTPKTQESEVSQQSSSSCDYFK
jgi:hypothetical protein